MLPQLTQLLLVYFITRCCAQDHDAQAYYNEAFLAKREGNYKDSLPFLRAAIRLSPDSAFFHGELGKVELFLDMEDNARKHFKKAFYLDPNNHSISNLKDGFKKELSELSDLTVAVNVEHFFNSLVEDEDEYSNCVEKSISFFGNISEIDAIKLTVEELKDKWDRGIEMGVPLVFRSAVDLSMSSGESSLYSAIIA